MAVYVGTEKDPKTSAGKKKPAKASK